ncbi:MAG: hypothetical protein ACLU3I_11295 [Acutalibacteraceae bacterium]
MAARSQVIAQVRAGQTQHHIVLTAPTFQQLIQAVTAETLPTGLLLKPVGAEELFRLLRAVEQPSRLADAGNLCLDSQGPALFHRAGRDFIF